MKKIFKKICCFLCICVILANSINSIYADTDGKALNAWLESLKQSIDGTDEVNLGIVRKCLMNLAYHKDENGKLIEPEIMSQTEYNPGSFVYENGKLKVTSKKEEYSNASNKDLFGFAFSQAKTIGRGYAIDNMPAEVSAILDSEQAENVLYAQVIYEDIALEILKESLQAFLNIINTSCAGLCR